MSTGTEEIMKNNFDQLDKTIQQVFNKVYCRNLNQLFKRIDDQVDIKPAEKESLRLLCSDLISLSNKANKSKKYY